MGGQSGAECDDQGHTVSAGGLVVRGWAVTDRFDVLVSCGHDDQVWVRVLAENLERAGLNVFYDEWEIGAGDVPAHRLDAGILGSTAGILVISPHALSRPWAAEERAAMLTPRRRRSAAPHLRTPQGGQPAGVPGIASQPAVVWESSSLGEEPADAPTCHARQENPRRRQCRRLRSPGTDNPASTGDFSREFVGSRTAPATARRPFLVNLDRLVGLNIKSEG